MNKKLIPLFSILALLIFVLGAFAAKAEPVEIRIGKTTITFLPLVIQSQAAEAPRGVLYVFPSTTLTDGWTPGGRPAMQNICYAEDPDAHFCFLQEIEKAWLNVGVHFASPFPESWVDNPSTTGLWGDPQNSCDGWLTDASDKTGTIIYEAAKNYGEWACSNTMNVACCKWMP